MLDKPNREVIPVLKDIFGAGSNKQIPTLVIKTKIDIIITGDRAPVLPNSKVEASALGISATIPAKIINEIPFPIHVR